MNRALQSFLLWFMIAMMPVQGIAAVIKASCGPTHHNVMQAANEAEHHHHDGVAAHASIDSMFMHASMNADDAPADSDSYKSSFCSACAACCVGAVGPPALAVLPSSHGSSESFAVAANSPLAGVIPAGLDRPPKSDFA